VIGAALLLAVQAAMGVTPQGQVNINQDTKQGPPDLYLQDDIYDITGQHLCDRTLSNRWKRDFDKLYRQRLEALHRKLISIFGAEAMARGIIRISSCQMFIGASAEQRREMDDQYERRRAEFARELQAWERYAVAHSRN
jgi:hypothetical protein